MFKNSVVLKTLTLYCRAELEPLQNVLQRLLPVGISQLHRQQFERSQTKKSMCDKIIFLSKENVEPSYYQLVACGLNPAHQTIRFGLWDFLRRSLFSCYQPTNPVENKRETNPRSPFHQHQAQLVSVMSRFGNHRRNY